VVGVGSDCGVGHADCAGLLLSSEGTTTNTALRETSTTKPLRALGNRLVGILHGCLRHHTHCSEHTAKTPKPLDKLRPWDVYKGRCRRRCRFSEYVANGESTTCIFAGSSKRRAGFLSLQTLLQENVTGGEKQRFLTLGNPPGPPGHKFSRAGENFDYRAESPAWEGRFFRERPACRAPMSIRARYARMGCPRDHGIGCG